MASDRESVVLLHRVLACHAPREVCDDCPQPLTNELLRQAWINDNFSLGPE